MKSQNQKHNTDGNRSSRGLPANICKIVVDNWGTKMLYRDVDKKLDMQFEISIDFKVPLVSILEKELPVIPAFLHHTDNYSYLDLFVHKPEASRFPGLMKKYKPSTHGDYYVVRLRDSSIESITELSKRLLAAYSYMPGELFTVGDKLHALARFHHSEQTIITNALSDSLRSNLTVNIDHMGSSPGGTDTLSAIDKRFKLSMVSFEFTASQGQKTTLFQDDYAEMNIEVLTSEKYRLVLYPDNPYALKRKVFVISRKEGVFATGGTINLLKDLYVASDEMLIPVAASISRRKGGKLRIYEFIPTVFKDDFIENILEVSARYPDLDPILTHVSDFSSDVFEWI